MARRKKKNNAAIPVGIITLILAIIGLVVSVKGIAGIVENRKTNMYLKDKYEEFLKPVVMFDPDPFDDLTQADNAQLIYAAVWDLLLNGEGTEKYSYSQGDNVGIVVPREDIEEHFIKLFGTEIDIASLHTSIDMSRYDISYDAALQSYILPITGVDSAYVPEIYGIDKQGTSLILDVGYIGNKAWADIKSGEYTSPEPDKFMKITLRAHGDDMFISAIQDAENKEVVSQFVTTTEYIEDDENYEEYTEQEETTEYYEEPSTEAFQPVTDENGEQVTDENGEPVTEPVAETTDENGETTETEVNEDEI